MQRACTGVVSMSDPLSTYGTLALCLDRYPRDSLNWQLERYVIMNKCVIDMECI